MSQSFLHRAAQQQASYRMSFGTGGLHLQESIKLADLYASLKDWDATWQQALDNNLLQARTQSSLRRTSRELILRLQTLSTDELALLTTGTPDEQTNVLWLAVCRCYPFVGQFATEVLHERYITLKATLRYEDFDAFFNQQAQWRPALEDISRSTRGKLRQVLFRILREAKLLDAHQTIQAALLSPRLQSLLTRQRPADLTCFPVLSSDLNTYTP